MKKHIEQLRAISKKRQRRIIGLMSGTSLDGLDVALCSFSGAGSRSKVQLTHFATLPYPEAFRDEVRRVFAKKEIDFQHLTLLNVLVAQQHADLVNQCLTDWGIAARDVDLLASHGQTVYHAPRVFHGMAQYPDATLQIGDGDHIARRTGIITLSDFRQKHVAAGGEGAPLALYGDYFLFSKKGAERYLLNIGGIANFTYLPADGDPQRAFATDTGPGNTLLDSFARILFNVPFDEGARLAAHGRVLPQLLDILKTEPFFAKPFPKTIGPELFSAAWVEAAVQHLPKGHNNPYDLMATLAQLSADTIAEALLRNADSNPPVPKRQLYLSGGGAHNPFIVSALKKHLKGWRISPMSELGIDGDAKEAVLFAALANETLAGNNEGHATLGGVPLVGMGKISFPD
jgi:anhydro-N-acetylmuramic acid kinase